MALPGTTLNLDRGVARITGGARVSPGREPLSKIRKILLIQPPEASPLDKYVLPTRYPLTLFTLSSALMQRFSNLEVVVVDLALPNMNLKAILKEERPDMVGITFMTPQYKMAESIVKTSREVLGEGVYLVGGGVHATAKPQETMREINFDFLVLHEGELTFSELISALDKGTDPNKVRSIAYRLNKEPVLTERGLRLRDLDRFPPATETLPPGYLDQYAKVRDIERTGVMAPMFTSRGCSFACVFCASNVVFLKEAGVRHVSFRSPDHVLAEMRALYYEHGIRVIRFADDSFDVNRERILRLMTAVNDSGMSFELSFMAAARKVSDYEKERDYYSLLQSSGVRRIAFGVESGDLALMQRMGKTAGLMYAGERTRLLQMAGIQSKYYLMVGLPGQDWASIGRTKEMLYRDQPDKIGVAVAMPYPGTRLARMPGIRMRAGYEGMIHEPPLELKGESFVPLTETDVMTSEKIGRARDELLRFFPLPHMEQDQ